MPLPVTPVFDQTRFHWIIQDVLEDSFQFLSIPDEMVITFMLPECPRSMKNLVGLQGRIPFQVHEPLGGSGGRSEAADRPAAWWDVVFSFA